MMCPAAHKNCDEVLSALYAPLSGEVSLMSGSECHAETMTALRASLPPEKFAQIEVLLAVAIDYRQRGFLPPDTCRDEISTLLLDL